MTVTEEMEINLTAFKARELSVTRNSHSNTPTNGPASAVRTRRQAHSTHLLALCCAAAAALTAALPSALLAFGTKPGWCQLNSVCDGRSECTSKHRCPLQLRANPACCFSASVWGQEAETRELASPGGAKERQEQGGTGCPAGSWAAHVAWVLAAHKHRQQPKQPGRPPRDVLPVLA